MKRELLRIARLSIESKLDYKDFVPDYTELSDACFEKRGVFVVLIQDNFMKSMSGITEPNKELYQLVQECAVNAAFYTKIKVTKLDLPKIVIEISLVGNLKKLDYSGADDLQSKINSKIGLVLKEGMHKQVFLPTMWRMYPDKRVFLDKLCSEAGLQDATWMRKPLDLQYFTTESFAEDDEK